MDYFNFVYAGVAALYQNDNTMGDEQMSSYIDLVVSQLIFVMTKPPITLVFCLVVEINLIHSRAFT